MGGKTAQTADFRIISGICQLTSSTSRLRRPRRPGDLARVATGMEPAEGLEPTTY